MVQELASENSEADPMHGILALFGLQGGNYSTAPTVILPSGFEDASATVSENTSLQSPALVNGSHAPVGKVYDIKISSVPSGHVYFGEGKTATLTYQYNEAELKSAGLTEEFMVYFYDSMTQSWMPVDQVETDYDANTVVARTPHFTPFVLTAAPLSTSSTPAAPDCIGTDFPGGVGGSGSADFITVDENFKYYRDRDYVVLNQSAFTELGFAGSLGISTCNGGGSCGPLSQHKHYTGTDYINITAHIDLDVYVMYDSRGGANINDDSNDAAWLTASGFVNTGKFIETTDGVQFYKVYKKSYNQGDAIALHGNRYLTGSTGINTNYWVILKPLGSTAPNDASQTCTVPQSGGAVAKVTDFTLVPGADEMLLLWTNPTGPAPTNVVVRRSTSTAPATMADGEAPTGTELHTSAYLDSNLSPNTTYYYSIFALDANGSHQGGTAMSIHTGPDADGDGIADHYEDSKVYPNGDSTKKAVKDTDVDGVEDRDELIAGTNPVDPDVTAPVVTAFTRTSASPTTDPVITYTLTATDDRAVTHYLIKEDSTRPTSMSPDWQTSVPGTMTLGTSGTRSYYAWAMDEAGNISADVAPITLDLQTLVTANFLFGTSGNSVIAYKINQSNGHPVYSKQTNLSFNPTWIWGYVVDSIKADPTGKYLFIYDSSTAKIRVYEINPVDGGLTEVAEKTFPNQLTSHDFSPNGRFYYAAFANNSGLKAYSFDQNNGTLTEIQHLPSHGFQFQDIDVNSSGTNLVAVGTGVSMHIIDQNTGELSYVRWDTLEPFDMRHTSVDFHPSLNRFYVTQEPIHVNGTFVAGAARIGTFSYNPGNGDMSRQQSIHPQEAEGYGIQVDPRNNWVYTSGWHQIPFGPRIFRTWRRSTNGEPNNILSTFAVGVEFENQNSESMQFFVPRGWAYGNNTIPGGGRIYAYQYLPPYTSINTAVASTNETNIERIALSQSRTLNDPPSINLRRVGTHDNPVENRMMQPDKFASGRKSFVINFDPVDPDFERCSIDGNNTMFQSFQVELKSQPAASSHALGQIPVYRIPGNPIPWPRPDIYATLNLNNNKLHGHVRLKNIKPGNYEFDFSLQDNGDICGTSRAVTASKTITVVDGTEWSGRKFYLASSAKPTAPHFPNSSYSNSFATASSNGHVSQLTNSALFRAIKEVRTFHHSCGFFDICDPGPVQIHTCHPPVFLTGASGYDYWFQPFANNRQVADRRVIDWCIAHGQAAPAHSLWSFSNIWHEVDYDYYRREEFVWIAP